jgi:hypothetical protein
MWDSGDNPVFIDGYQCWRRYKYGGWVTMWNLWGCSSYRNFHRLILKVY